MGRKHSKEEVLKALTAKGCIITNDKPITKKVDKSIPIVEKKVVTDDTGNKQIIEVIKTKQITINEIVQEPYCINVTPAHNNLGNGSWGKIDYLVGVHNYRVVRIAM